MKNLNTLIVKHLQPVVFVYVVENVVLVRKLTKTVGNTLNIAFVMHAAFEKKVVNALQKHTLLDIKRLVCKSLVWSRKKILQDAV